MARMSGRNALSGPCFGRSAARTTTTRRSREDSARDTGARRRPARRARAPMTNTPKDARVDRPPAAEEMDGLAAEIRIRGALDLLASVVEELNFAFGRFLLAPDEQHRELDLTRILAEAIPPERRFT